MVSYIKNTRWIDPSEQGVKVYWMNSLKEALEKILEVHSYGPPEDDEGNRELQTVDELIHFLDKNNGDGCDFVISIISDDGEIIYDCNMSDRKNG